MKDLAFNAQNIVDGQGIEITVLGMVIVFSGLILVSLFIGLLPQTLVWYDQLRGADKKTAGAKPVATQESSIKDEIAAVVALVVHSELELDPKQRITIQRGGERRSLWTVAGRMRTLSTRT